MGKRLNLERKEKSSGMKQVSNVAASAFFFQSLMLFSTALPASPGSSLHACSPSIHMSFFTFSVFPSRSGALIWEVKLLCHRVNW